MQVTVYVFSLHTASYAQMIQSNVLLECNLFLLVSAGMFSISQMKNRPMILIGG